MAIKPKLTARPAGPDPAKIKAEQFLKGAGKPADQMDRSLPWEAAGVRSDVMKNKTVRLSEPMWLKLKFVAEHSGKSAESMIREALEPVIEARLKELLGR